MFRKTITATAVGVSLVFAAAASASTISSEGYVLGPTTPGKWGSPVFGTGAAVTYSYMADGVDCSAESSGCTISALSSFMPTGFGAAIDAAFDAWSDVADITFTEVADTGEAYDAAGGSGDIRLGGHAFDGSGGTLAHGYYPPANGTSAAGDIHFDIAETWKIGFGGAGFDVFQVAAHEIGHAIGLGHETSVTALMNPFYTEAFKGLKPDDVDGAQFIYGPAAVIPVPAALPLLGGALALLGFVGYRRKHGVA